MKSSKNRDRESKKTTDLDEMREAFRQHKAREKGGSSKNDWDKFGPGKNLRWFLPRPGHRKFYTESWTHFNVGPNDRALRCLDEEHMNPETSLPVSGTKCPRCKRFLREQARINSDYKKGDRDGQEEWKNAKDKYVPRHQFYSNVLREDDEGDFEVKIAAYGPQIWGQLMNYYLGDDTDVGDFTDPESGRWINVKKESKGGKNRRNIEYKVFPSEGPGIGDAWDTIKEALHDLDVAAGKVLSVDEFVAVERGVDPDKDNDDDASDGKSRRRRSSDDDDDDDDRGRRRRSRDDDDDDDRGRRRKSRDDDDREDDEEEEDDDRDDDDEEDRPVRAKDSKLSSKMKNRRDRDRD